jgi:hypothetical protein
MVYDLWCYPLQKCKGFFIRITEESTVHRRPMILLDRIFVLPSGLAFLPALLLDRISYDVSGISCIKILSSNYFPMRSRKMLVRITCRATSVKDMCPMFQKFPMFPVEQHSSVHTALTKVKSVEQHLMLCSQKFQV